MKLKCFCKQRVPLSGQKGNSENGKRFSTSDGRQVAKIYKQFKKLGINKVNNPIKKWTKDVNREFSIEITQMVETHLKACSKFLAIRKNGFEIPFYC